MKKKIILGLSLILSLGLNVLAQSQEQNMSVAPPVFGVEKAQMFSNHPINFIDKSLYWYDNSDGSFNFMSLGSGQVQNLWKHIGYGTFIAVDWNGAEGKGIGYYAVDSMIYKVVMDGSKVTPYFDMKKLVGRYQMIGEYDINPADGKIYYVIDEVVYPDLLRLDTLKVTKIMSYDVASNSSAIHFALFKDIYAAIGVKDDTLTHNVGRLHYVDNDNSLLFGVNMLRGLGKDDLSTVYRLSLNEGAELPLKIVGDSSQIRFDPELYSLPGIDWTYVMDGYQKNEDGKVLNYGLDKRVFVYRGDNLTEIDIDIPDGLFDENQMVGFLYPRMIFRGDGNEQYIVFGQWRSLGTTKFVRMDLDLSQVTQDGKYAASVAELNSGNVMPGDSYFEYITNYRGFASPDNNKVFLKGASYAHIYDRGTRRKSDLIGAQKYGAAEGLYPHADINNVFFGEVTGGVGFDGMSTKTFSGNLAGTTTIPIIFDRLQGGLTYRPSEGYYYWVRAFERTINGNVYHELVKAPASNLSAVERVQLIPGGVVALFTRHSSDLLASNFIDDNLWIDDTSGDIWLANSKGFMILKPNGPGYYRVDLDLTANGNNVSGFQNPFMDQQAGKMYWVDSNCLHSVDTANVGFEAPTPNKIACSFGPWNHNRRLSFGFMEGNRLFYTRSYVMKGKMQEFFIKDLTAEEMSVINDGDNDTYIDLNVRDLGAIPHMVMGANSKMLLVKTQITCASGKLAPGKCGCDIPDEDKDFDGKIDCVDEDGGAGR